ncbi:XdhC family protein [Chloroflexota bacterium]
MMEHEIYQELAKLQTENEDVALVTVISASGSTPREEGVKMLVRANGSILGSIGGGRVEEVAIKEAITAMRTGKTKRSSYQLKEGETTGMVCGGYMELFIEPVLSSPTLFIFGGGHITLAMTKMYKPDDFKIVVIDDRPEFATPQRFPEAEQTIIVDYARAFTQLTVRKSDYIVIITNAHKGDEAVLEEALKTEAKYIGMLSSKSGSDVVFSHLKAKGVPQEILDKVHTPIGLKIRAQTPAEIAISILAEVIKVRRSSYSMMETPGAT